MPRVSNHLGRVTIERSAVSRKLFVTIAALIGLLVGVVAFIAPGMILGSKGVFNNPQAEVWTREVGVLIASAGAVAFLVRSAADSVELKAILAGNFLVQAGLFPIELLAWNTGTIPRLSGIVPNTLLHGFLATGFCWFALRIKTTDASEEAKKNRTKQPEDI
jgi:hypothetical protein